MSTTRMPNAPRTSSSSAVASSSRRRVRCARAPMTRPSEASAGWVTASGPSSGAVDRHGLGRLRDELAERVTDLGGFPPASLVDDRLAGPVVDQADLAAGHLERASRDVAVGAA